MKLRISEGSVSGFRGSDKKDLEQARTENRSTEIDIKFRPTVNQILDYFSDVIWVHIDQYGNESSKRRNYGRVSVKIIYKGSVDNIPDDILDMCVGNAHWFTKYKKHDALSLGVITFD